MEEARKRRADRAADDGGEEGTSAAKKLKPDEASAEPQDDDWISAWLALDDDAVSELLDLLDPASSSPSPSPSSAAGGDGFKFKVRFIDDPYASPLVFQSSSSFVTINGNEESCGSSFSESESTVMASIDTRGIGALRAAGGEVGRARVGPEAAAEEEGEGEGEGGAWATKGSGEAHGCCLFGADGDDDDDAAAVVVAGFLGGEEEEVLLTGLK